MLLFYITIHQFYITISLKYIYKWVTPLIQLCERQKNDVSKKKEGKDKILELQRKAESHFQHTESNFWSDTRESAIPLLIYIYDKSVRCHPSKSN